MTEGELTRLRVINQTIDGILTIGEAADLLNLSERQVIRLKGGVIKEGPAFIIHKNRGGKPSHAIPDEMKRTIIKLKQSGVYREANFNHFRELSEEHEGIVVSYPTVHRILSQAGIVSPKKHHKRKVHHRRKRKPQEGMLVQINASPHTWFIGGGRYSLHGAIDDATGKILSLFFSKNECLEGYFQLMRRGIKVLYDERIYETKELREKPKVKDVQKESKQMKKRRRVVLAEDYPWRLSAKERPRVSYEESDRELLERLYNSTQAWA